MGGEAKKVLDAMDPDKKIPKGQKCQAKVERENSYGHRECKYPAREINKDGEFVCKFHDPDKVVKRAARHKAERVKRHKLRRLEKRGPSFWLKIRAIAEIYNDARLDPATKLKKLSVPLQEAIDLGNEAVDIG